MRAFPAYRMYFTFEHAAEPSIYAGWVDVRENLVPAAGPPASFLQEIEDSLAKRITVPVKALLIHEWHVRSDCHSSTVVLSNRKMPYEIDPRSPD
jgi:hypothetical protein